MGDLGIALTKNLSESPNGIIMVVQSLNSPPNGELKIVQSYNSHPNGEPVPPAAGVGG